MLAKDLMTGHAAQCTPRTSLRDAATLMVDHECGCLPVAKDFEPGSEIIGMITERDLICRVVASTGPCCCGRSACRCPLS